MRNQRGLKVRRHAYHLININEYLYVSPGAKASGNAFVTELNVVLLNRITNSWSKQGYFRGFDC